MADLSSQPKSIQSVYSLFRENKLIVNRRYQRKLVWTLIEKQKLIESIQNKYPIPAILVAEKVGTDEYEIIDGLQRLHAIVSFIENNFQDINGKYFDVSHFPTAKSYADNSIFTPADSTSLLSQRDVGNILDYMLSFSVMKNATTKEIDDVFGRINTFGHRLSDQERRQAGVQTEFSRMVRIISCGIRGDASPDSLPLGLMPSISIDMPKNQQGYEVKAEDVFWVEHGILRSTDLRDSMDEQCIADIAACCIGADLIHRSKDAVDSLYDDSHSEFHRINAALAVYGAEKFAEEFNYCLSQLLTLCACNKKTKLRDLIFPDGGSNPFQAVFAILMVALHEKIFKDKMLISDFNQLKHSLNGLSKRIETGKSSVSKDERRKNIDVIKGLISSSFYKADIAIEVYGNHSLVDIDAVIRRSSIELSDYELKQGFLLLHGDREIDQNVIDKVLKTICAIANNGPKRTGKLIIGVADKEKDAQRIKLLDSIEPKEIGDKYVVGIDREAKALGITIENYLIKWKDAIKNSSLSEALKKSVLSHIDYNSYYGLGIIVITVNSQDELSYLNEQVYWRSGDSTEQATLPKDIAYIAKRF